MLFFGFDEKLLIHRVAWDKVRNEKRLRSLVSFVQLGIASVGTNMRDGNLGVTLEVSVFTLVRVERGELASVYCMVVTSLNTFSQVLSRADSIGTLTTHLVPSWSKSTKKQTLKLPLS